MARIKRFLWNESGTAEGTSIIIMIAAAGILMAAGVAILFGGANTFFTSAGSAVTSYAAKIPH